MLTTLYEQDTEEELEMIKAREGTGSQGIKQGFRQIRKWDEFTFEGGWGSQERAADMGDSQWKWWEFGVSHLLKEPLAGHEV